MQVQLRITASPHTHRGKEAVLYSPMKYLYQSRIGVKTVSVSTTFPCDQCSRPKSNWIQSLVHPECSNMSSKVVPGLRIALLKIDYLASIQSLHGKKSYRLSLNKMCKPY